MQTHNRHTFTTIHTEGALLPVDLLQRIRANDAKLEGLDPESYHLAPGEKINEAINRSWNRLNGLWGAFQTARGRLGEGDLGTTLTRERWLLPLFQELGYGRLNTSKAVEMEGKSYPISHRWQTVPIHLVGCGLGVDKRTPGAAGASRTSPHSLVQEYLNRSDDAQWGLVSNGLSLRVLRDNAALTRQAYIDFDLESIFDGEVYSDFILLWLICHQSRFETTEKQTDCLLERWSKSAQESGTRALDDLRRGVEGAIVSLGQGFLQHTLNNELRTRLKNGDLPAQDFYRQLLRLVYRLIFLFAAEDRDLLLLPDAPVEAKKRYLDYYSTVKLRLLSDRQRGSRHYDRYEGIHLVFKLLSGEEATPLREGLALPALGGFLFDSRSTVDLNEAKLDNQALLTAIRSLAFITEGNTRRAVDYRNLGPEELGSVYESLLELHPLLNTDAGTFELSSAAGNERKTTGSYYTPSSLINVLLDSALDPVIEQAIAGNRDSRIENRKNKSPLSSLDSREITPESRLLDLKVCDPACGSGHFLIAAAHRIAGRLAELRAEDNEPSPIESRHALRDVIRHCIYGVDINPMAVELCKVNLWLESIEPGKPLSFLDAHIKCGNSLVGVGPKMDLNALEVPDEAFNPVTGDHKPTAALLKKRNKQEREGQESLFVTVIKTHEELDQWLAERTRALEAMPEDNAAEVQAKAEAYQQVNESVEYRKQKQIADLWTATFFWKIDEPTSTNLEIVAPTHGQLHHLRSGRSTQSGLVNEIEIISQAEGFFHWPLEFAEVTTLYGFDCILGNPPWERIKLQEEEFFAIRDPLISAAPNKAARQKLINQLVKTNPTLSSAFESAKHSAECNSKFVRYSLCYPLTAFGDVNTYALFSELARDLPNRKGRAGIIVPTGISTDDTTKNFFSEISKESSLVSLYDFQNSEGLFSGIHRSYKFCLLTLSGSPIKKAEFVFFATRIEHLRDPRRLFSLEPAEIELFNPNTRTMPVFRTQIDANLTRKIYQQVPVLINDRTGENAWKVSFLRMFDMANDSGLFLSDPSEDSLSLYEAKMAWQYDHRWSTYVNGVIKDTIIEEKNNPNFKVIPHYYINSSDMAFYAKYIVIQRALADMNNERRMIMAVVPFSAVANSAYVNVFSSPPNTQLLCCYIANINSVIIDYLVRIKAQNPNLNQFILKQLAILPPTTYSIIDIDYISARVLELVYTAFDLKPFADDMGYHGDPFRWDEDRRAMLRAELDAYYAKLYGLTRDELRYILDPQDVYGPDFPGETFRVLKDKEIRLYGEYRTRRLVLEAWDRLAVATNYVQATVSTKVQSMNPPTIELETKQPPRNPWIPTSPNRIPNNNSQWKSNFRNAVVISWIQDKFGKDKSISLFYVQKYCYFLQREKIADLDLPYQTFAAGPYSPSLTYQAGIVAKKQGFWEVKGKKNVVRGRNINKAIIDAQKVISNENEAINLLSLLSKLSEDDLGGLATVDFAAREVFTQGKEITPDNLRAYFATDWPEKAKNQWFSDKNIYMAFTILNELGLLKDNDKPDTQISPTESKSSDTELQPSLGDMNLYKCDECGVLVMGFDRENHVREKHGGQSVEWKKIK